jgi:hypothetical protein
MLDINFRYRTAVQLVLYFEKARGINTYRYYYRGVGAQTFCLSRKYLVDKLLDIFNYQAAYGQ